MKILLFLLSTFFLLMCTSPPEEKSKRIRPVKYIEVEESGVKDEHTFTGTAKAKEKANLSFKVAGTVNHIDVIVGDVIRKGQFIASLEPTDYQVTLQQAEAQEQASQASEHSSETQIKSSEANYIAARSSYIRITQLYENNSVSLNDFEQAKANYEAAKANYEAAKAQFEAAQYNTTASIGQRQSAKNQVEYTRLLAPFSGIVSQQHVEENELVASGTPVITLSSIGRPEVEVGVPEILISRIREGAETFVKFSTLPGQQFEATVTEVGYSPGSGSTYPVTVDLVTADDAIRPGMSANVTFQFNLPGDSDELIIVPTSSVGEDSEGRFVYILNQENDKVFVQRQSIVIGKIRNEGIEVLNGLNEGDMIAAAGLNILQEGDQVRL